MNEKKPLSRILLLWVPLVLFLIFLLFPFYWTLVTSLKTDAELHSLTVRYWPTQPTLQAYEHLFGSYNFLHPMKNSLKRKRLLKKLISVHSKIV
jgi:multiple sugar transport system permease protein